MATNVPTLKQPLVLANASLADFSVQTTSKKSDKHVTIYSNASSLGVSPWDIRIAFGKVVEGGAGTALIDNEATIIMSPGQAKALSQTLNKTIEEYEKLFGKISDPMAAINAAGAARLAGTAQKKSTKK